MFCLFKILAYVVATATTLPFNGDLQPIVLTHSGFIQGKETQHASSSNKVMQYLGIPFAEPPIGDRRFAPPSAISSWCEPKNVVNQPASCIQYFGNSTSGGNFTKLLNNRPPPPSESEDCLYLNVYAPKGGKKDNAVLFWLFGGAFSFGAASHGWYDGTSFAANQDIIVVAPNYRTGLYGFPRSPQLQLDERNLGLLDQRLALEWVQRNIHVFGGDPNKVTLVGESAGAASAHNLVNTMPNNPPFRGAILQSGQSLVSIPPLLPNDQTTSWDALISHLNCTSTPTDEEILSCARRASTDTLNSIVSGNGLIFNLPVSDNVTRLETPALAYAADRVANVPIMSGSTFGEGSGVALGMGDNVTEFMTSFGLPPAITSELLRIYSPNSTATLGLTSGNQIISQFITDALGRCPAGFVPNVTSNVLGLPSWQYVFNASFPNTQHIEAGIPDLGAYHASELPIVFGTYEDEGKTEEQVGLSKVMQKAWADFVKDPNAGPGWEEWPNVGILRGEEGNYVRVVDGRQTEVVCQAWNLVYAAMLGIA